MAADEAGSSGHNISHDLNSTHSIGVVRRRKLAPTRRKRWTRCTSLITVLGCKLD